MSSSCVNSANLASLGNCSQYMVTSEYPAIRLVHPHGTKAIMKILEGWQKKEGSIAESLFHLFQNPFLLLQDLLAQALAVRSDE